MDIESIDTHFSGKEPNVRVVYDALILNFRNDYEIKNPRPTKVEKHSAHRLMHFVKLEQPAEIDAELLQWLADAYQLAG